MKEIEDIVRSYKQALQTGRKLALATVVHVEGSSYRRPGARMLVTDEGQLTGAISGGCLEGDALRKALLAISQQQNKLVVYNTIDEEDRQLGIQLGCNGIVYILFEPIDPTKEMHPLRLLEKVTHQQSEVVLLTLFNLQNVSAKQPGTVLLFEKEHKYGQLLELSIDEINTDVHTVFNKQSSLFTTYTNAQNETLAALVELLKPPVQLCIAGAGNDVFPIAAMAAVLGWKLLIADGRKTHATAKRFPSAKNILIGKPEELICKIKIDDNTVMVLMSHNYNYDLGMLRLIIKSNCRYIGVLGPKKKLEKMLEELENEGMKISEKDLEKIFGPVGLDIGAETSEEIALSILSEIKAVLAKKNAGLLRDKNGFIHEIASNQKSDLPTDYSSSL